MNKLAKTFKNIIWFSLYLLFVLLTALMMVWLNYSGNLATLKLTIVVEQKILCTSEPTQKLQPEIFKFVERALSSAEVSVFFRKFL